MPSAASPRPVRLAVIEAAVCRRFRVSSAEILGPLRTRSIARPRQVAMYLAAELSHRSLTEIGRRLGNRDHATVGHARKRVRQLLADDREFAEVVKALRAELQARAEADAARPPCTCSDCRIGDQRFPLDPPQLHLPIALPGELQLEARAA